MSESATSPVPGEPSLPNLPAGASDMLVRKLALIFVVFLGLQIPLMMISSIMEDRQKYNVEFPKEFEGAGAGAQTISGPVLTVPYHYVITEDKIVSPAKTAGAADSTKAVKTMRDAIGFLHFFPENLTVKGNLKPDIRDEGKFKSILYSTALEFKGAFDTADFEKMKISDKDIRWPDASIALGISDLRGISQETTLVHVFWMPAEH